MRKSNVKEPAPERDTALASRLLRGGVWVVVGRIVGIVLLFLTQFLLARLLDPEDFGLFVLLTSVLGLAGVVAGFGLDRVIVRFVSESLARGDAPRAAKVLKLGIRLGLVSTLLACLLWTIFLNFFGESLLGVRGGWSFLLITVAALAVLACAQVVAESFRGFSDLRFSSLFYAQRSGPLHNLVFLGLLLAAWNVPLSLERSIGFYVLSLAVMLPLAVLCLWRIAAIRLSGAEAPVVSVPTSGPLAAAQVIAVCVPIMLTQLLAFTSTQADIWIAGAFCPRDQLALFGAAQRLVLLVGLPLDMISLTVVSAIAELYSQGRIEDLQRVLQTTAGVAALPSLLVFAVFIVVPDTVLTWAFGPFYRDAATALMVLAVGQVLFSLTGSCGTTLTMTGHHNVTLVVNLGAAIALVVLGPLAAARFGISGLAVVSACILVAKNLVLLLLTRKLVGVWTTPRPSHAAVWLWRKSKGSLETRLLV